MSEYVMIDACQFTPNYNYCLLEALAAKGHRITYATTEFAHDSVPNPPGVRVVKCFFLLARLFAFVTSSGQVRRLFRALEYPFDLVYLLLYIWLHRIRVVNFIWIVSPRLDLFVIRLLQAMGCKVVYTAHNSYPHDSGEKHKAAYGHIYKTVDHIVALSEYTKRDVAVHGRIEASKISVVPLGGYDSLFTRYSPNTEICHELKRKASGRKIVAFLGLIRPYKGLEYFLAAIPIICQRHPEAFFVVAGNPLYIEKAELLSRLRPLVAENRLFADIRFLPNRDLAAYFSVINVLVQPYVSASQSGNTIMAYSAGIPVVSANVGGLAEMTADGITGYIVPPRNSEALATAVDKCLDKRTYSQLSANARKVAAEKYTWDSISNQFIDVFNNRGINSLSPTLYTK